jgi:hypothetical protein
MLVLLYASMQVHHGHVYAPFHGQPLIADLGYRAIAAAHAAVIFPRPALHSKNWCSYK